MADYYDDRLGSLIIKAEGLDDCADALSCIASDLKDAVECNALGNDSPWEKDASLDPVELLEMLEEAYYRHRLLLGGMTDLVVRGFEQEQTIESAFARAMPHEARDEAVYRAARIAHMEARRLGRNVDSRLAGETLRDAMREAYDEWHAKAEALELGRTEEVGLRLAIAVPFTDSFDVVRMRITLDPHADVPSCEYVHEGDTRSPWPEQDKQLLDLTWRCLERCGTTMPPARVLVEVQPWASPSLPTCDQAAYALAATIMAMTTPTCALGRDELDGLLVAGVTANGYVGSLRTISGVENDELEGYAREHGMRLLAPEHELGLKGILDKVLGGTDGARARRAARRA